MKKSSVTGLAYFRKMRGLLQAEVSEALGIPSYKRSLYETGRRTPLIKQYLRISEVLENPAFDVNGLYTPHSCRHAFAAFMKRIPGNSKGKLQLIGHTSEQMLQYYQDVSLADLRKITVEI